MKKLRCLLVDDEPLAIALLRQHIGQLDLLEVTGACSHAVRAMEFLNTTDVDLVFLDIRMPNISGIDLLKTLRHPPKVIITTAYREYALDGYDLDIVDYLLKPITFDRFLKAVERFLRQVNQPSPAAVAPEGRTLYVKSGHRHVRLSADEILYMESLKDYVKIHMLNGSVTTKYRISDMEADLGDGNFLRVHRSFIVNMKKVAAYTASHIEVAGSEVPIGESYRELFMRAIRGL